METINEKTKLELLIDMAFDMLDSTETVIENVEVTSKDEITYQDITESEPKVTSQPTFRGEDREKIKQWLLNQLV